MTTSGRVYVASRTLRTPRASRLLVVGILAGGLVERNF